MCIGKHILSNILQLRKFFVFKNGIFLAQDSIKLMILLPQPLKFCDFRCVPPHLTRKLSF